MITRALQLVPQRCPAPASQMCIIDTASRGSAGCGDPVGRHALPDRGRSHWDHSLNSVDHLPGCSRQLVTLKLLARVAVPRASRPYQNRAIRSHRDPGSNMNLRDQSSRWLTR